MYKNRKFSEAEEAAIRTMHESGKTIADIAAFVGAATSTIFRIVSPGARDRYNQYLHEYRTLPDTRAKWAAIAEQNAREAGYV